MRSSQVRRGIVAVGLFLTTTVLLAACNLAPDDPGPGESPRAPVSGYPSVRCPSSQLAGGQPWWPYVIFGALMLILIVIGVVLATGPKRRRPPARQNASGGY
ncbi:hypothetical protein [Fodinicola feengrottensis]|uniref:hypothetical protein n=1 Tax=Fodinicola feengrottensis TaxID=435914 RepID=UPI0013D874C8|nr:hypothetical protein [Fodinicola feengrottensis]